jgi:hypothetical protein
VVGKTLIASLSATIAAVLGFLEDLPLAVVFVLTLVAPGVALWLLNQIAMRQRIKGATALPADAKYPTKPYATDQELAQRIISGRAVRLADLVRINRGVY